MYAKKRKLSPCVYSEVLSTPPTFCVCTAADGEASCAEGGRGPGGPLGSPPVDPCRPRRPGPPAAPPAPPCCCLLLPDCLRARSTPESRWGPRLPYAARNSSGLSGGSRSDLRTGLTDLTSSWRMFWAAIFSTLEVARLFASRAVPAAPSQNTVLAIVVDP
jgi:hypothetical protein